MKNRKKIGILALICLACCLFTVGGFGLSLLNRANAATVENVYILEEYGLGKVFTIPKAKINADGKIIDSEEAYLVFPSGKASKKSPIVLDEEGKYLLVYTATSNGKSYEAKVNFAVTKQIYKVGDEKSSAYFGTHPSLPALEGVVINLVSGDSFVYDEIIDLSDNTKEDSLIKLSMFVSKIGEADVGEMAIRFTDIYDENNFFVINIKNAVHYGDWAMRLAYITAGGAGQVPGGWENVPGASKFHTNNEFGFPVQFSMSGLPYNTTRGYDELTLSYDDSQKTLYTDNQIYPGGNEIAKFDDREAFLSPWAGFTTGEARMSITGVGYKTEMMHVVITAIDGKAPAQKITTDVAPEIRIDALEGKDVPYALVGKDYRLFEAYAFDAHEGEKDVDVHVYYNYGKDNQTVCNVVDGRFVPKNEGAYTIVYTSSDGMDNVAKRVVTVEAFDHDGMSVEVIGQNVKGYTGKEITLFEDISSQGASGDVTYKVEVNGEEILPVDGKYSFMPLKDGKYTVKITATDYVKTETVEYEFSTIKNYTPQIYGDIALPKYLIEGEEIILPSVESFDYASGTQKRYDTKIFVKENGGAEKEIANNVYTPSQIGEVEVIYRADVSGRRTEKSAKATVISVFEGEALHIEKYFKGVSGNAVMAAADSFVTVTATEDSVVEFINRVQVKDFNMTFVVSEEYNSLSRINVYLTDVLDQTKKVKLSYVKGIDGSASFAVNDGPSVSVEASFISDNKNFALSFADGKAYGSNTVYSLVAEYLDGRAYNGFSGDLAYLTIEMERVSGKSELCLKSLNRQSLNNSNKDRFAPQILTNAINGDRTLNETIVISETIAADVLCNRCDFTLKVLAPDGSVVKANDGTLLDGVNNDPCAPYEITLSMYGEYFIEYCAIDRFGRDNSITYYLNVKDSIDPVIALGEATKSARVGDTVTVGKITVSDNISEEISTFICVETPEGVMVEVVDGKFVAEMAGGYTVRYMVWDEADNYAFKSYTVTVK